MIDQILEYNRAFVARKGFEPYVTDKYPAKKLAVLSCMDTRLTELLPQALGLRNGDAKIIRNAGGIVLSEVDSAVRSLLVAIYELGVDEVMVVHHSECGACHMSYEAFRPHMVERGIPAAVLAQWEAWGIAQWLEGFHDTEASVRETVAAIRAHSLVPRDVVVRGFIIDSKTGALTEVDCSEEGHCCCHGGGGCHGEGHDGGCCHGDHAEGHEGGCCHGGSHEEGCCHGEHGEGHEGGCCHGGHGEGHRGHCCHHHDPERLKALVSERVDVLSGAFDRVAAQVRDVRAGKAPRTSLEALREEISALDQYQRTGLWLMDYEADEAGLLNPDINRSILSQDGLYNLLRELDTL